jgi:hypothetical protein
MARGRQARHCGSTALSFDQRVRPIWSNLIGLVMFSPRRESRSLRTLVQQSIPSTYFSKPTEGMTL